MHDGDDAFEEALITAHPGIFGVVTYIPVPSPHQTYALTILKRALHGLDLPMYGSGGADAEALSIAPRPVAAKTHFFYLIHVPGASKTYNEAL